MASNRERPGVQFVRSGNPDPQAKPDPASEPATKPAKPTRQAKTPRVAPADAVIPTKGFPAVLYRLNIMRGRPDLVPKLGKKEQQLLSKVLAAKNADDREAAIITWLEHVFNTRNATISGEHLQWRAMRGVVAILNQKGGSAKSSLAVTIANIIATLTKKAVIIVPATRNPGSTTLKAGAAAKDTLDLLELEKLLLELTNNKQNVSNANDITDRLRHNGYGVYVIAQKQLPDDFNGMRLRWIIEQLKGAFPFIVLDTGNDVGRQNGVEFEAARQADALVFTCATNMPDSPNRMSETMDSYTILNDIPKLSRSLVVVNGTRPDEERGYWAKFAEYKVNEFDQVVGIRDFPYCVIPRGEGKNKTGEMLFIPWDDSVVSRPIPELELLGRETYRTYLEVVYHIIRSIGVQQKLDFGVLDAILKADASLNGFDYTQLSDEHPTPADFLLAEQLAASHAAPYQGEHS